MVENGFRVLLINQTFGDSTICMSTANHSGDSLRITAIVQARMGSKRLPGKIMQELGGRKVIEQLITALEEVLPPSQIVIATSEAPENAPFVDFCNAKSWQVVAGDEENVASRFKQIIEEIPCTHFIRISGDSPLFDPQIITTVVDALKSSAADVVSTVSNRPYPSGMNAELISAQAFLDGYQQFEHPDHFEHVSKYFYEHATAYHIHRLECPVDDARTYKFTLDTLADKARLTAFFEALDQPHWKYTLAEKTALMNSLNLLVQG